jgi:DNA-binding MarR family transcriptional regulator
MLSEILELLKERGPMTLAELARHFQTDVAVMEDMLGMLERKSRVKRLDTKCSRCKGCTEVKPEDSAIFQALEATVLRHSASRRKE